MNKTDPTGVGPVGRETPAVAMTIAGSDSGAGAGIQADLKTFAALGVYGTSVITALTAQNTRGVTAVRVSDATLIADQFAAIVADFPVTTLKIGMLANCEQVEVVGKLLSDHPFTHIVIDPVMVATSGDRLVSEDTVAAMQAHLVSHATLLTPNIPEAIWLAGDDAQRQEISMDAMPLPMALQDHEENSRQRDLATRLAVRLGTGVVVTGGHGASERTRDTCDDIYATPEGDAFPVKGTRVRSRNTHGTGCSFSAAIAAGLAMGHSIEQALTIAKAYVEMGIAAGASWRLGAGCGPIDHFHGRIPVRLP